MRVLFATVGGRGRVVVAVALAAATFGVAGVAAAMPPPAIRAPRPFRALPPKQAVALVAKGVVWFDNGTLLLEPFLGANATLGYVSPLDALPLPPMVASATAVAGLLKGGAAEEFPAFIGGVPPGLLVSIPPPQRVSGAGCQRWEPAARARSADFVVAGDTLVTAAECDRVVLPGTEVEVVGDEVFERQPLLVKDLRGGPWRVLRWLPGDLPPVLAAEGNRLAIGLQESPVKMEVSIVDARSGLTQAHFGVPDGYLSFASPERVVLSTIAFARPWEREFGHFPLEPQLPPGGPAFVRQHVSGYSLALYSTRGRRIASIGSSQEPPLVSHMHGATLTTTPEAQSVSREVSSVLSVRSLATGATTQVIGFNPPGRALITVAFRWPALVVVETTSASRSQSELTCSNTSEFQAPSRPFLTVLDLARSEAFLPPPPSPHLEMPARCPRVLVAVKTAG